MIGNIIADSINLTEIAEQAHGLSGVNKAIKEYNKLTDKSSKSKFAETISQSNTSLGDYLKGLADANGGLAGYAISLATASLKTVGLRAATMALNATVSLGTSALIESLISGISYLINYEEKQKEAFENAKQATEESAKSVRNLKSEMSDTTSKASSLSSEFATLVQGVNPLTNENKDLSTEEYERFLELSNELAELFLSLTHNYDENGNAILGLSGDVDTVTASIKRLVEQQNNLAKADIRNHLEEYVNGTEDTDGVFKVLDGKKKKVKETEKEARFLKETYDSIINQYGSKYFGQNGNGYNKYLDNVKNKFGQEAYDALLNATNYGEGFGGSKTYNIDFSKLQLDDPTKEKITNSYNTFYQDLQTTLSIRQSELEAKNKELSDMMMVWVEEHPLYINGNQAFKKAIQTMVGSIQWSDLKMDEENLDEVKQFIQEIVLNPLVNACKDPDSKLKVTNALNSLFTFDFSNLNYKEANKKIKRYLSVIMDSFNKGKPEDKKKNLADMYDLFNLENYEEATNKMGNSLTGIASKSAGLLGINPVEYAKLTIYTKDFTQSQAEAWLAATDGAKNADDAIRRYEESLNSTPDLQSKSFFQVWDSIGTSGNEETDKKAEEAKEKLLELAKAEKLTEETLKKSPLAKVFTDAGISIEEATKKINDMKSSADQLAPIETGISSISSILDEKEKNWESDEAHNKGISPKTLAGMPKDIKAQTKEYGHFIKVLRTGTSQMDECYDAAIKLAAAYVKNNNLLDNLTDESEDYFIYFLKQLGLDNAESIVNETITANKEKQKYKSGALEAATKDLTNNTSNESKDFLKTIEDEKEISSLAKTELADLIAKERIFNSDTLSTSEKVNELNKLAEAYWGVSDAIQISSAMGADPKYYDNPKDYDNAVKNQWDKTVSNKSNLVLGFSQRLSPINTNPKKQGKKQDKEQDKKQDKENNEQQNRNKSTQQIDWISRSLDRLSSRLDLVKAQYDNLFNNKKAKNSESLLTLQNKNLNEQYKLLKKTAKYQGKAQKRYSNKAKSVQISKNKKEDKSLKKAVREGRINAKKGKKNNLIAKYGEEKADKIQEYQDWFDKAEEAEKNKINAQTARRQNRIQKYQNKADNADKKRSLAQARKENAKTANAKKNYINKEKDYIKSSYNNQIKAARREKDSLKVKQLKAEKKKEIRESNIEIHQNFADQHQSELDRFSAEKENLKTANEKNAIIEQEKASTSQLYKEKIEIARLEGNENEMIQLQAEKVKVLREYDVEKHQNFADQYQSELDKFSAEKENLKTANEKNAVIDQEKAITSQLYEEKIEIARLAGNENEMAQLQAEKAKELRDFDIEKHQNLSNQYQAELDRYSAEKENLKTANEKNAVVDQETSITSQLYREKIEIAKLEGNQSEELRLQAELSQRLVALEKEKFDNIVEYYKNLRKINEYQSNNLKNSLDELEARGLIATSKLYTSQMALNDEKKQNLQKELSELKQQHDKIDKESPTWYDSLDSIQACEDGLAACIRNSIELGNAIRNIDWQIFEKSSSRMDLITSEFDLGIKLMSNKKMISDKTGNFTEEGIATIGAYYSKMLLSQENTNNMWSTLETMRRHIDNKDPGYTDQKAIDEYNEKYQEYIDLVGTEYDLQQHIIDMMKDKYKADLDHLQDIINKRKELLQAEKDSYDFQKNIEEKTKNIAVITKQLNALGGDDSEEAKTRIQQLQVSLDEANKDLQDTEYQQWITDQQTMLDNLYNEYSDFVDNKLNDVDALLQEAVTFLGNLDMSESVLGSLEEYYKLYGYKTTEDFQKLKDELGNSGSIVRAIGTAATQITEYFKTQQKNQSKADDVAAMVSKIGNVFEDVNSIERYKEAQKAFDSLTTGGVNGENIKGYVASSAVSTLESTGNDIDKIYADVLNFKNIVSSIGNTNDPSGYNDENSQKLEHAYNLYNTLSSSAKQLVVSHKNILDDRKYWYDQNKIIEDRKKKEEEAKKQTQIENLDYYIKSTYGASAATYATNIRDASSAEIGIAGAIKRRGLNRGDGYNSPNNDAISKIVSLINSSGMGINIAPTAEALWNYMQNIGYSHGGIADTLQKLPGMNGDDGWATLKRGEAVLTPEQTEDFQKLLQNLDVLNSTVDLYKNIHMGNVDAAPDRSISQSTGDINIDMSFPGVTNYEEFRQKLQSDPKIESMFKSMIWDKGSLSKYNTKM